MAGVFVCAGSTQAALNFTGDEAAFALAADITEDFTGYADDVIADGTAFGAFQYNRDAGGVDTDLDARPLDGQIFAFLDGNGMTSFTVSATGQSWTSFGINVLSGDSFGGTQITLSNGDSFGLDSLENGLLDDIGTGFVGFTSDSAFDSVTFSIRDPSSFEGVFINTFYAVEVPAPGAAVLVGVAGLAGVRRRR